MKTAFERLRDFYNGKWYAMLVTVLILIGHTSGYEIAFFIIMMATVLVGCAVADDFRFAVMPVLCTVCFVTVEHTPNHPTFSDYYVQPIPLTILTITFGAFLCGILLFVLRNRRRAVSLRNSNVLPSLFVLCAVLLLNGLFSASYTVQNLLYACSFPLALLGIFLLFGLFVRFDSKAFDYFLYCLTLAGALIVAQLFLAYGMGDVRIENGVIQKDTVCLGWAVWNSFGGLLTMLMPACFYFAATHRNGWIFYLLGLLEFVAAVLSQSRTATLIGAAVLSVCLITVCFFGAYKKRNRLMTLGVIVIGGVGILLLWGKLMDVLRNFINYGFDDNGRLERWKSGWTQFSKHPIFGAGFYDSGIADTSWEIKVYPYLYHNTWIQMLGSAGIVGFLAYAWHRFCTVRLVLRQPSLKKSFLAIGLSAFLVFGMVDVLFFITYPLFYYALMLLFMEKSTESNTTIE